MAISKKFFVDIDLQGNGLNNSTVGANANMTKAGSFQYNAAETRLEYFNGSLVEQVANLSDIAAVTGGLILQSAYNAATNTPNITDGNALKGYFWVVTVAGTFLGETVQVGDSIIAKVDEAGALLTDWLILQGNVVIATTEVAGITYLATQEQVNGGTETGAYAVTPATLQGKLDPINTDITNLENDKLARDGSQAMTGSLDMGGNEIQNVAINNGSLDNALNAQESAIINLPAPTNGGDATNKTYVDGQITAQSYTANIATGDWTLVDGVYEYVINHNLDSRNPQITCTVGDILAEIYVAGNNRNQSVARVNNLPDATTRIAFSKVTE